MLIDANVLSQITPSLLESMEHHQSRVTIEPNVPTTVTLKAQHVNHIKRGCLKS